MNLFPFAMVFLLAAGVAGGSVPGAGVEDPGPPVDSGVPDAPGAPDEPGELCDGEPPHLVNKDGETHAYTLTCGKKVEERSIKPAGDHKLEGKSGCVLRVGDNAAEKLFADMVCEIRGGKVSCDLL